MFRSRAVSDQTISRKRGIDTVRCVNVRINIPEQKLAHRERLATFNSISSVDLASLRGKDKPRLYIALRNLGGVLGGGILHAKGEYSMGASHCAKIEVADMRAERHLMPRIANDDPRPQEEWVFETRKSRSA